jgi:hypothetical protein
MQFMQWKRNEFPDPLRDLLRQQQDLRRTRKELVRQLYATIAELEGRPVRRQDIGFPYSLIVSIVRKALSTIQALIQRAVKAVIK